MSIRIITGALTAIVFLGIGVNLLADPASQRIGAVLAGLGVFRAALLAKQWNDSRSTDEPGSPD